MVLFKYCMCRVDSAETKDKPILPTGAAKVPTHFEVNALLQHIKFLLQYVSSSFHLRGNI